MHDEASTLHRDRMFNRRVLDKTLASAGFPGTAPRAYTIPSLAPLEYAIPSSCDCVAWEIWVDPPRGFSQRLIFGVTAIHAEAVAFARRCLSQYAGKRWADAVHNYPELYRGLRSPIREFDEQIPGESMSHQSHSADETALLIADSIRRSVLPFIATINSERTYYDALVGETPLNWRFAPPMTRAGQVAFLGAKFGVTKGELEKVLMQRASFIKGQLDKSGVDVSDFIASIVSAALDCCEERNDTGRK